MGIVLTRILSLIPKKPDGKFVHGALKEFANKLNLKSGNVVSDWMNGRSTSYTSYVYQIADIYNVSVEWLKGETDDPSIKKSPGINAEGLSAARKALLDAVDGLTDEQCEKLLGIVLEAKAEAVAPGTTTPSLMSVAVTVPAAVGDTVMDTSIS